MNNQEIVDKFFEAYLKSDFKGIEDVMSDKVSWAFRGDHKLAGTMHGIQEVIDFFDKMGAVMMNSKPKVEKLIVASNDNYLVECQHIKTNREDGINIEHHVCVLWTFENGKIVSGEHFFADPVAVNNYFNSVS